MIRFHKCYMGEMRSMRGHVITADIIKKPGIVIEVTERTVEVWDKTWCTMVLTWVVVSGGSSVEIDGSEVLTMTCLVKGALRLVLFLLFGMELKDVMALTLTERVITVFDKKIKRLIGRSSMGRTPLVCFFSLLVWLKICVLGWCCFHYCKFVSVCVCVEFSLIWCLITSVE